MGYEKFILDADQAGLAQAMISGVDLSENGQALDTILGNGPGKHYLDSEHTLANFETAFWMSEMADNNSFEQWEEDGSRDAVMRAHDKWTRMLNEYEAPPIDAAMDEELSEWIVHRKSDLLNADV
jgi:trimethylamine--corrinoid protein Co-methyltransferase